MDTMNLKTKNNIISPNKELKVDKSVFLNVAFAFLFKQQKTLLYETDKYNLSIYWKH